MKEIKYIVRCNCLIKVDSIPDIKNCSWKSFSFLMIYCIQIKLCRTFLSEWNSRKHSSPTSQSQNIKNWLSHSSSSNSIIFKNNFNDSSRIPEPERNKFYHESFTLSLFLSLSLSLHGTPQNWILPPSWDGNFTQLHCFYLIDYFHHS